MFIKVKDMIVNLGNVTYIAESRRDRLQCLLYFSGDADEEPLRVNIPLEKMSQIIYELEDARK